MFTGAEVVWRLEVAPSQERGLKLTDKILQYAEEPVAPSQERGLKLQAFERDQRKRRSLLRRSVD